MFTYQPKIITSRKSFIISGIELTIIIKMIQQSLVQIFYKVIEFPTSVVDS